MQEYTERHFHPSNPNEIVIGNRLEPGDILAETDLYDSTSGSWSPVPCPGLQLQIGASGYFVRPQPQPH